MLRVLMKFPWNWSNIVTHQVKPSTTIIDFSFNWSCSFPDRLKEAQVTFIYKKSDSFLKNNYRPVSILHIPLEKVLAEQLSEFFSKICFINFTVYSGKDTAVKQLYFWKTGDLLWNKINMWLLPLWTYQKRLTAPPTPRLNIGTITF